MVHNNDNIYLTKPNLATSMRKIFREEFEKNINTYLMLLVEISKPQWKKLNQLKLK